tara:strand:+ start:607 stop:1098 length:492 start_codon:yes stop_codon:yes gene_type:complete
MPSVKQTTVDPAATTKGLGTSSTELMTELYPNSPVHNGDMTRTSVQAQGNDLLIQGTVTNGFGIPSFSRDFTGQDSGVAAPDQDVATGGGGLPASPFVPNPASPGPGSQNPTDLPAPPEGFGSEPNGDTYGSGPGALANPVDTAKQIAGSTLGSYGLGTSKPA